MDIDLQTDEKNEAAARELLKELVEKYSTEILEWLAFLLVKGDRPPYPSPWAKRARKLILIREQTAAEHRQVATAATRARR